MKSCMVPGCSSKSNSDPSIGFFLFPQSLEQCQLWVVACQLINAEINLDEDVVCSRHFTDDAFNSVSHKEGEVVYISKALKEDAVPTENLPCGNSFKKSTMGVPKTYLKNTSIPQSSSTSSASLNVTRESISPSNIIVESSKYDNVRTSAMLKQLKEANEKLLKNLELIEFDLKTQKDLYLQKKTENMEVRKKLKKYAEHVFSRERAKAILSKVFSQSQIKVLVGKKKTYWSDHDMAVGYTIRHLSNISCYNYLIKNMNIPLPGIKSIKRWINVKGLGKKKTKKTEEDPNNETIKSEDVNVKAEENEHEQYLEQNDDYTEDFEAIVEEMEGNLEEMEGIVEEIQGEMEGMEGVEGMEDVAEETE